MVSRVQGGPAWCPGSRVVLHGVQCPGWSCIVSRVQGGPAWCPWWSCMVSRWSCMVSRVVLHGVQGGPAWCPGSRVVLHGVQGGSAWCPGSRVVLHGVQGPGWSCMVVSWFCRTNTLFKPVKLLNCQLGWLVFNKTRVVFMLFPLPWTLNSRMMGRHCFCLKPLWVCSEKGKKKQTRRFKTFSCVSFKAALFQDQKACLVLQQHFMYSGK